MPDDRDPARPEPDSHAQVPDQLLHSASAPISTRAYCSPMKSGASSVMCHRRLRAARSQPVQVLRKPVFCMQQTVIRRRPAPSRRTCLLSLLDPPGIGAGTRNLAVTPRLAAVTRVETYAALADEIYAAPPRLGQVRLVTIDGPSGSGKSVFAQRLVSALSSRGSSTALLELEMLYEGWTLDGMWRRLRDFVLEPVAAGWDGGFHPYDWSKASWSPRWCSVPVRQVLVVEGCGSSPRDVDMFTSRRIWIEAAPEVALARGVLREGVDLDRRLRAWQHMEAAYFAEQGTRARADLLVDGDPALPLGYDPDVAFTALF